MLETVLLLNRSACWWQNNFTTLHQFSLAHFVIPSWPLNHIENIKLENNKLQIQQCQPLYMPRGCDIAMCHNSIYRVSQEECARLRESVPYVKVYRYNPKHLCPKLNGYRDNGQRKVWASLLSTYCTPSVTSYLYNAPARQLDMVMQWPWRVRYSAR